MPPAAPASPFRPGQRIQGRQPLPVLLIQSQIRRHQLHQLRCALIGIQNERRHPRRAVPALSQPQASGTSSRSAPPLPLCRSPRPLSSPATRPRSLRTGQCGSSPISRSHPSPPGRKATPPIRPAFQRHVPHAVANHLVLANDLVVAVFQDQAVVMGQAGRIRLEDLSVVLRVRALREQRQSPPAAPASALRPQPALNERNASLPNSLDACRQRLVCAPLLRMAFSL